MGFAANVHTMLPLGLKTAESTVTCEEVGRDWKYSRAAAVSAAPDFLCAGGMYRPGVRTKVGSLEYTVGGGGGRRGFLGGLALGVVVGAGVAAICAYEIGALWVTGGVAGVPLAGLPPVGGAVCTVAR